MSGFEVRPLIEDASAPVEGAANLDAQVVACAAELFLRHGIESVKMVDIARAAQVGVATVYRHFSTKGALAVSAVTLLWKRFNRQILRIVESDQFLQLDGLGRLYVLLEAYCTAYSAHADFVSLLDEFDHLVLSDQLNRSGLVEYGAELESFYPIFEDAYLLGRMDGSIVREVAFRSFYLALAHALIGVAQKLCRGEIIPTDDFSSGEEEMRCIINMAIWSLTGSATVPRPVITIEMEG